MRAITEIEAERRGARITKSELCAKAGVNIATYRRLEIGKNMPNLRTLEKLAAALDTLRAQRIAEFEAGAAQ